MNAWAKLCATNPTTALSSLFIYKPDTVELISSEGLSGRVLVADLTGLTVDNAAVPRLVELIKGAPSLEALLFHSQGTMRGPISINHTDVNSSTKRTPSPLRAAAARRGFASSSNWRF